MLATLRTALGWQAKRFKHQDDLLSFTLPGNWQRAADPSVWLLLNSADGSSQFIVSLVRLRELTTSRDQVIHQIEALAAVRRDSMRKLSENVQIGSPEIADVNGKVVYDFMAKSEQPTVQMYVRYVRHEDLIASFCLYDSSERTAEEHLQLVRQAFATTGLR